MRAFILVVFMVASNVSLAVEIALSTVTETSFRPTFKGTTNLPDGAKLTVLVTRKESAYRTEASTEVRSGRFAVGPISQRGNDLNPGLYSLEVVLAAASDQPASVLEVIGKRGEKLEGPLVKRNGDVRTIRYATTFQVGLATNPELDRIAREHAKMSQTRWWKRQCDEICDHAEFFERDKGRSFNKPDCLKTCVSNPPTPRL